MFGLGLTQYIPLAVYITCLIVIVLALFYKARIGIYLVTLLIPLQSLMDKLIIFPSGKDIMDILFLAILISIFFHKKKEENVLPEERLNKFILLMFPFTYSALWIGSFKLGLSYPVNFNNPQLELWKNFIMMPLLYFMILATIDNKRQIVFLVWIMLVTIFLMDVNFYQSQRWISHETFLKTKRTAGSTFSYLGPNEFAAFYAMMTMFLIGLLLTTKEKLKRGAIFCLVVFNSYCILFLYSRGAYVASLVGLVFFGLTKKRSILLILLLLFIGWHTVLPKGVVERIQMTKTEEGVDPSVLARFQLWGEAIQEIKINPFTGVGFGSTQYLGFKTSEGSGYKSRRSLHNGYIEMIVEQGFLGLGLFLYIFCLSMKKGWSLYQQSGDNFMKGLGLGFVGLIIASLVANMFGNRWSYFNLMGYFWVLLGLVVKAEQLSVSEEVRVVPETVSAMNTFSRKIFKHQHDTL